MNVKGKTQEKIDREKTKKTNKLAKEPSPTFPKPRKKDNNAAWVRACSTP